jgi:hypothetical protein
LGNRQGHEPGVRGAGDGKVRQLFHLHWTNDAGLDGGVAQLAAAGAGAGWFPQAGLAFATPQTSEQKAWADLCDEHPNPLTEAAVARLGGWEAIAGKPLTYDDFKAALGRAD